MSLILKGIDLPKDTEGISVTFHTADGWRETHILDVAEAIQIPKGHGRLIDESDITVEEDVYYQTYKINAPTILGEESEEE